MKRWLFVLICLLLLPGCEQQAQEETTQPTYSPEFLEAEEIGTSGYRCITGESETQETGSGEKTVAAKAFSHRIYGPEGDYLVTLTTTVITNRTEEGNKISSVSGTLSEAQKEGFTLSEHVAGNTGTVILYLNQLSVCHFQYRVQSDGTVSFL